MYNKMDFMVKIEKEIEGRIADKSFMVKDLYESMGIFRSSFWEIFSHSFGTSPGKLIEGRRMVRALKLIVIEHRLSDVARKSGFSNLRSFTRAFKRQFNICPRDFKKMLLDCALQNRSNYCDSCMYKNRTK